MTADIAMPAIARIESTKLFDAYLEKYNGIQESWNTRLRDTHKALFGKLIELLDYQFRDANQKFGQDSIVNPNFGIKLTVSSYILSRYLKCASSTIRLRLSRLVDSGVILRIVNHGQNYAPDLILNPAYLKIGPVSELFSKGLIPVAYPHQNLSSAEYCSSKKENNKINSDMDSDFDAKAVVGELLSRLEASKSEESSLLRKNDKEPSVLLREHKQELERSSQEHEGKPKSMPNILAYQQKIDKQGQVLRAKILQYALLFITLATSKFKLWKDRADRCELYDPEFEKTVDYIAEYYFSHCTNNLQLERTMKLYEERLKLVSIFRKKKKWDLQWPMQYFDVNNPVGFTATRAWLKKLQLYNTAKDAKKRLSDNDRLLSAVKRVKKDKAVYMKEKNYILTKAPHLAGQFDEMIKSKHQKTV